MAKRILIVDDDLDIVRIVKTYLVVKDYEVVTAGDGEEALKEVERQPPNLIVADLLMPKLNGWWMVQSLKDDERYKMIPIILISGMIKKDTPPDPGELGSFYFAKPFELKRLLAKIEEFL